MLKTQNVSVDLLHYIVHEAKLADIVKVATGDQIADIFTKSLSVGAWLHALKLLKFERACEQKLEKDMRN